MSNPAGASLRSPLAHTPWWATPLGLIVATVAAKQLASQFPAAMLIVGVVGIISIATAIVLFIVLMKR